MNINEVNKLLCEYEEIENLARNLYIKGLPYSEEVHANFVHLYFNRKTSINENFFIDDPNSNSQPVLKESFCKNTNDITILKHFRYIPPSVHQHEFIEIMYMLSGSCVQKIFGVTYELREGELCIISPNVEHSVSIFDDSILINILVRKSTFNRAFFGLFLDQNILSGYLTKIIFTKQYPPYLIIHSSPSNKLKEIVLSMILEQIEYREMSNYILNSYLSLFFSILLQDNRENFEMVNTKNKFTHITLVLQFMHDNYKDVSLASLAENFYFSKEYLSQMIKLCTGTNFIDLLNSIKLGKAADLLINSSLPIYEICKGVGYTDVTYFTRIFKKRYMLSPSQYRQNNK